MTGTAAIWVFVLSLIAAIMLHELGHLLTAKWFGMRADRFFLGFGPTLWSTRRGETEYGVKLLPLGGFVRIVGMSPIDERRPPIAAELLVPEALARDRREAAERAATDPLSVPNLPGPTWVRFEALLEQRGTPHQLAVALRRQVETELPAVPTAADAAPVITAVIDREVPTTGRHGDLRHRLLEGDAGRFFHDRPAWQRAIVLVAGSLAHFLIAIAVLAGAYLLLPQLTGAALPVVEAVLDGSPAAEAGLEPGDRVVAVGEVVSEDFDELRAAIMARPGRSTELVIERDGVRRTLTVVPDAETDPSTGQTVGRAGFVPASELERLGAGEALRRSLLGEPSFTSPGGFVPMFTGSLEALVRVFSPDGLSALFSQATGQTERGVEGAVSLVGAASIAGQTGGDPVGLTLFLALIAAINVFIGIFNLVPLPPLDGGHLAVLGIERAVNAWRRLRGRAADFTVDPRAVAAVALPVIGVLAVVFLALLWLDITDPIRF